MEPSSTICRKQEAVHRAKALASPLENVRLIATKAANAWASEALIAERREARKANAAIEAGAANDTAADDHETPVMTN